MVARQFHWHEKLRRRKKKRRKRGRAKIPSPQPPFFLPARAEKILFLPSKARQSNFALRIFVKKSSDFNQKTPPSLAEAASYGGRSPPVANREGELRQYELFCLHFKMFRWETLHGLHSRSKRKNGKTSEKTSFCYSYTIAC